MIEIFAGAAVLCSVAKQLGMRNSIAVDKVKKRNARSTIYQLDLLSGRDQKLLEQWMLSGLLLWIHLAPVCGTASRARDIRRFEGDPKPLRQKIRSGYLLRTVCLRLHATSFCWLAREACWLQWKIQRIHISSGRDGLFT